MKKEKTLFGLRVPECAEIKSVKKSRELGVVAMTMILNGNEVTFFRTDFLPEIKRIAWDENEKQEIGYGFYEEIPENLAKSIRITGGIFIARNFVMINPEKTKIVPKGIVARGMNYEEAQKMAASLYVPKMEATLIYGAIYDTLGRWLIATGSLSKEEWVNSPESEEEQSAILDRICGDSDGEWTIRELFGDIFKTEWTKEKYNESVITREGIPFSDGEVIYSARKRYIYPKWLHHPVAAARTIWFFRG